MDKIKTWLSAAENQDHLYQATVFWKKGIEEILYDFETLSIENFRNWPSSHKYFVPTYNHFWNVFKNQEETKLIEFIDSFQFNSKQKNTLKNLYSGFTEAESDFRVLKSAISNTENDFLLNFSETDLGNPKEQFSFEGKKFSRSSLNYLMGMACLGKFVELQKIHSIIEVGGGFGSLGEIIEKTWPSECKYLNFDIPPICNISDYYLRIIAKSFKGINEISKYDIFSFNDLQKINVAPNWKIANFCDDLDLFVNFISFQEMELEVIENYFNYIQKMRPSYILLRHIREGKQKLSKTNKIGVKEPTTPIIYQRLLKNYEQLYSCALPFGRVTHDNFHSDILIFKRINSQA